MWVENFFNEANQLNFLNEFLLKLFLMILFYNNNMIKINYLTIVLIYLLYLLHKSYF